MSDPTLFKLPDSSSNHGRKLLPLRQEYEFPIIMICWAVPLMSGLVTFELYHIFQWRRLEFVGLCVFTAGILMAIVGFISSISLFARRWNHSDRWFRDAALPALLFLILLASNFWVAFTLIWAAMPVDD